MLYLHISIHIVVAGLPRDIGTFSTSRGSNSGLGGFDASKGTASSRVIKMLGLDAASVHVAHLYDRIPGKAHHTKLLPT